MTNISSIAVEWVFISPIIQNNVKEKQFSLVIISGRRNPNEWTSIFWDVLFRLNDDGYMVTNFNILYPHDFSFVFNVNRWNWLEEMSRLRDTINVTKM